MNNFQAEYSVSNGEQSAPEANKVRLDALEVEQLIQKMVDLADTTVVEVNDLALSLDRGTGIIKKPHYLICFGH